MSQSFKASQSRYCSKHGSYQVLSKYQKGCVHCASGLNNNPDHSSLKPLPRRAQNLVFDTNGNLVK